MEARDRATSRTGTGEKEFRTGSKTTCGSYGGGIFRNEQFVTVSQGKKREKKVKKGLSTSGEDSILVTGGAFLPLGNFDRRAREGPI